MPKFSTGFQEKNSVSNNDYLLIGDSADLDKTKKIKVGLVRGGGGGGSSIDDNAISNSSTWSSQKIKDYVDGSAVVPTSYDKDIISVSTYAELQALTDKSTSKLYMVTSTNKLYSWNGSAFVEMSDSNVIVTDDLLSIATMQLTEGSYTIIYTIAGDTTHTGGDLHLVGYTNKISAVKAVREITGWGLSQANIFVSNESEWERTEVKSGLSDTEGNEYVSRYQANGGTTFSFTPNEEHAAVAKVVYTLAVSSNESSTLDYKLSNEYGFAVLVRNDQSVLEWVWKYYAYTEDLDEISSIKQDKLTAGNNITIEQVGNNLYISSTGGSGQALVYLNKEANDFVADATYEGYQYKCEIDTIGVVESDLADVVFDNDDAMSGNYSPICATSEDKVTIYAKTNDSITIPVIMIHHTTDEGGEQAVVVEPIATTDEITTDFNYIFE